MPFINRHTELDRLRLFAQEIARGTPERHLALVGIRRIGKSRIVEQFLTEHRDAIMVVVAIDAAAATLQTYLMTMTRAVLAALARDSESQPPPQGANLVELASAAATFGPGVAAVVNRALTLAASARPEGHQLFITATTLPEEIARETKRPVMVFADEFQHLTDLGAYPPFRKGRGVAGTGSEENVLRAFRSAVERRPGVGWIVTGSSVRLLHDTLAKGALMGRFDIVEVKPFDRPDTVRLALAIWDDNGVEHHDAAAERVDALTYGHPFYADVVCRLAAHQALRLDAPVTSELVDRALLEAVHDPSGSIWIACEEIWGSLSQQVPAVRGIVRELAQRDEATVRELAVAAGITSVSSAYRHLSEIDRYGLVERRANGAYALTDPVFRYWLAAASNAGESKLVLTDAAKVARAIGRYEEAYLRERSNRGRLVEGYLRDVARNFAGQVIDGKRFGAPGRSVRLPSVTAVKRPLASDPEGEVFGHAAEIELDLCFGDAETWLAEVRDRSKRITAADVELLARKAKFLRRALSLADGPTWFVTFGGAEQTARKLAESLDIYVSGDRDVQAIESVVGVRRAP